MEAGRMNEKRHNPYIGPRTFTRQEGHLFFGREREARELLSLVISNRLVLFYAESGAGKSSLINTRLIPGLEEKGFEVLPVGRVAGELSANGQVENIYLYNLMCSLEQANRGDRDLVEVELEEFLASLVGGEDGFAFVPDEELEMEDSGDPIEIWPRALVIDQFEEILSTHPEAWNKRKDFFLQLAKAMEADPYLWVVLSLREEYVAALDPYAQYLPGGLRARYYMQKMGVQAALEAIKGPVSDRRPYAEGAAEQLVDDLRKVTVQKSDLSMETHLGPYVEPVQLQVVCYRLWMSLEPGGKMITKADLQSIADVDQSLGEYYAEQVQAIAERTQIRERVIREWFESELITDRGQRDQTRELPDNTGGLDNAVVELLKRAHLVRSQQRGGGSWLELAHDRLVEPVHKNNLTWLEANLSFIQRQASLWSKEERNKHLLLREDALIEAERWVEENPSEVSSLEEEFLEASRELAKSEQEAREHAERAIQLAEKERSASRLRLLAIIAGVAAVVAILFAFSAVRSGNQATISLNTATAAVATSEYSLATNAQLARDNATQAAYNQVAAVTAQAGEQAALTAQEEEAVQRGIAETQQVIANQQAEYAATAAADARDQAQIASARQLAAQASANLDSQPDLSALLAVEAFQTRDIWESRSVLLSRVQQAINQTLENLGPAGNSNTDIMAVALSPDGENLAWSDNFGLVSIYNYRTGQYQRNLIPRDRAPVNGLAFSPDGRWLAAGGNDSRLFLRDMQSGENIELRGVVNFVNDLAFSPSGGRLAAIIGSQVRIWDILDLRKPPAIFPSETNFLLGITWSPDGGKIATAGSDTRVVIWDAASGERIASHNLHTDWVTDVAWSPNGNILASCGRDDHVVLFDVNREKIIGEPLNLHGNSNVYSVAFTPDGRTLASSGADDTVVLIDIETRETVARLDRYHDQDVRAVEFVSSEGQILMATGSADDTVGLFRLHPVQPLSTEWGEVEGTILAVQPMSGGNTLVASGVGTGFRVWNVSSQQTAEIPGVTAQAVSAAFNSTVQRLYVGTSTNTILVWDLDSRSQLDTWDIPGRPSSLALMPSGDVLAIYTCTVTERAGQTDYCAEGAINFLDLLNGELSVNPLIVPNDYGTTLAVRATDSLIAVGSRDSKSILRFQGEEQVGLALERGLAAVTALAFSPDGRFLATGSRPNELILWDLDTGQPIGPHLVAETGEITALEFSQDGNTLFAGSVDGVLSAWDLDPDTWMRVVCTSAGREPTAEEWLQYFPGQEQHPICP